MAKNSSPTVTGRHIVDENKAERRKGLLAAFLKRKIKETKSERQSLQDELIDLQKSLSTI